MDLPRPPVGIKTRSADRREREGLRAGGAVHPLKFHLQAKFEAKYVFKTVTPSLAPGGSLKVWGDFITPAEDLLGLSLRPPRLHQFCSRFFAAALM
jgi:hypothetical protein